MEENVNLVEENEQKTEATYTPKYTKQQTALYTILSIALFCILYFGGKGIMNTINRPYYMIQHAGNLTDELVKMHYDYAFVSDDYGLEYENSRLEKNETGYKVSILFSGIKDIDDFVEKGILFEFGDAIEDAETEFYPYKDNPVRAEYVTAVKYVNNDNPNVEILIFEYDGKIYAEYQSYGALIPTEVKILFDGSKKVY